MTAPVAGERTARSAPWPPDRGREGRCYVGPAGRAAVLGSSSKTAFVRLLGVCVASVRPIGLTPTISALLLILEREAVSTSPRSLGAALPRATLAFRKSAVTFRTRRSKRTNPRLGRPSGETSEGLLSSSSLCSSVGPEQEVGVTVPRDVIIGRRAAAKRLHITDRRLIKPARPMRQRHLQP